MKRRGQRTTLQERLEIAERAAAGVTDRASAEALGCSPCTVRKWRRKARLGTAALSVRLGRPAVGLLGTIPSALRQHIVALRQEHPGWGPDTILATLRTDPVWCMASLPSRTQVAAALKAAGLTRRYARRSILPQSPEDQATRPHELWQLDAQGVVMVAGVGKVNLINGVDVVSRVKVESFPRVGTANPAAEDYFLALRHAFLTYGLPERLSLDHGTVFFDSATPSPFPTRFHLWLVALGVAVQFIRPRRPTDHALVERTHQTMAQQALTGQCWQEQQALWTALDGRREVLNTQLPARRLGGCAPLAAYPDAHHSGRSYRPEWEADLLDLDRVYRYLATGRWFREVKPRGRIRLGSYAYALGAALTGVTVAITFDATTATLRCRPEHKSVAVAVPIQGISIPELMGEFATVSRIPSYQLALPFSATAARQHAYAARLTGTN